MNKGIFSGCDNNFYICWYQTITKEEIIDICNTYHTDGYIMCEYNNNHIIMHFYNRDSSRAPMCGNGIRCLAYFAYLNGLIKINEYSKVITDAGIIEVKINSTNPFIVEVNLNKPSYNSVDMDCLPEYINKPICVKDKIIYITNVFLGTHHTIVFDMSLKEYANDIQINKEFKKGTNVDFVEVIDKNNIYVETYERGVGWTSACGTGAASSFAVCRLLNKVDKEAVVHFVKGSIKVKEKEYNIYIEGICQLDKDLTIA